MSADSVKQVGFVTSQGNIYQEYGGVTAIDEMWEDVMEIYLSIEGVLRSPLAGEPARLVDIKARIKNLKEVFTRLEELAA